MSTSATTLQDVASVNDFLNVAATETAPLFEYLEFDFLLEYDMFAPSKRGRTRVHEPPELFRSFLHCTCLVERKTASGQTDSAQSHSLRDGFLTSEDAVAATHAGC